MGVVTVEFSVPAPELAHAEQVRADGLTARIIAISADERHPSHGQLYLYKYAVREAYESAARHAVQPLLRGL
ncbi:hypothetical protein GCM10010341_72930 [Streptomyces noursei]|nr:hypothetical protein GCM10010341_72930 [Streptomyces noursei]